MKPNEPGHVPIDVVGLWSELKLDIVREYAQAYTTILTNQQHFSCAYIDGFAGPGVHRVKAGDWIRGSPLNALNVSPPFNDFYLIDLDDRRVSLLQTLAESDPRVHVFGGDCNEVLIDKVFPNIRYEDYRRGLCLLDPYGLHLQWKVVAEAGRMRTIDLLVNFPLMDMNMNVLRHDQRKVDPEQAARMTAFWGDESWREVAYTTDEDLFGFPEKASNTAIVNAYRKRLITVGGFPNVPEPIPMRNSKGLEVYYLFFASQKPVAKKIITDIFAKYRTRGFRRR
jgi:three-Cys-motif partner protein